MANRYRLLPWIVRAEHLRAEDARMLSLEMCRRAGTDLRAADHAALLEWLGRLAAANQVIEYRSETRRGWWRVARQPDDVDIIRVSADRRR